MSLAYMDFEGDELTAQASVQRIASLIVVLVLVVVLVAVPVITAAGWLRIKDSPHFAQQQVCAVQVCNQVESVSAPVRLVHSGPHVSVTH